MIIKDGDEVYLVVGRRAAKAHVLQSWVESQNAEGFYDISERVLIDIDQGPLVDVSEIGGSDIDPEVLQARYDQQFAAGQRDAYDTIRKMVDLFEGLIKIGRPHVGNGKGEK